MANKKTTGPGIEPWEMPPPSRPVAPPGDQAPLPDIIRHSFRGPVSDADQVTVAIAGQSYPVSDIGSHGIGITLTSGSALVAGQTYKMTLDIQGHPFELQGQVKHISRDEESATFHCGIQLLHLTGEAEQRLQEFVLRQRHTLFAQKD